MSHAEACERDFARRDLINLLTFFGNAYFAITHLLQKTQVGFLTTWGYDDLKGPRISISGIHV
jgi:hypothetical protein